VREELGEEGLEEWEMPVYFPSSTSLQKYEEI
jgi:hypothetical protein